MVSLLLTNEMFYFSILSIIVLFHGIDTFFLSKEKIKSAIFYTILGVLTISTILMSTISQYNLFRNLPFNSYQEKIEKYESFSINPMVKLDMRLNSAHKIYINTGEIANYLDASKKPVPYPVSDDDKKQRLKRIEKDELFRYSIKENILLCKMIIGTTVASSLFGAFLILIRRYKSKSHPI